MKNEFIEPTEEQIKVHGEYVIENARNGGVTQMLIDEKNNIWKTVNPQWATNRKYRVRYVEHHPCDSVSLVETPESNNLVELAIPVNNREYAESMLTYDNLIKLRDSINLILKSNNVE